MPKRAPHQLRNIAITPHFLTHPEGSALIAWGDTKVVCTASVDERVPPWMAGKGRGWVTAEYDMLPRATSTRRQRDAQRGKLTGRTQEISRLIGRALRAVVDLGKLGERTITIDCDVIQADGGTRCAAITGGYVALALAMDTLVQKKKLAASPLLDEVAAVSAGILEGEVVLDLDYSMDSVAEVDMNVVMIGAGELIEIQGTGEHGTFRREQLDAMLELAFGALPSLRELQRKAVATPYSDNPEPVR